MVMEDTAKPRPTYLLKRGRYDMPDTQPEGRSGRARLPGAAVARACRAIDWGWPAWLGSRRKPTHGSGRRQPDLATSLRRRTGQDRREFRHSGRASLAPRASGLAGLRADPHRMGHEGAAPLDRDQRDVPAVVPRTADLAARDPENRLLARGPALPPPCRGRARQCADASRASWSSGSAAHRSSPISPPGSGRSSRAGPAKGRISRTRARALPPQPLCLPQANGAQSRAGHIRCTEPRNLPGETLANQHAASGARAARTMSHTSKPRDDWPSSAIARGGSDGRRADHLRLSPRAGARAFRTRSLRFCAEGSSDTFRPSATTARRPVN